jgi:osmotically-inducible protein OsmY
MMNQERPGEQQPPKTDLDTGPDVDPIAVPGEDPAKAQEAEQVSLSAYGEPYERNPDEPAHYPADEMIDRVKAALRNDPRTRQSAEQVVIQVTGDIVRLSGTVDTPATIEACLAVVQSVAGVGDVRTELHSAS